MNLVEESTWHKWVNKSYAMQKSVFGAYAKKEDTFFYIIYTFFIWIY